MLVGECIRRIRQRRGVTVRELARRLGVSHSVVSTMERGVFQINADDLPRIAALLGVSPRDFFPEDGAPAAPTVADRLYRAVLEVLADAGRREPPQPEGPEPTQAEEQDSQDEPQA